MQNFDVSIALPLHCVVLLLTDWLQITANAIEISKVGL